MMPLLTKFQQLQALSLHGNRLKKLPTDLSQLSVLTQIDISNNLFQDINDVVQSLKTLPSLTHLIMNFKNYHQETFIKNSLPQLQRLNKKPLASNKNNMNFTHQPKKILTIQKLSQDDLQKIGIIYDQIRGIYKQNKHIIDKQLADDFDRNVDNIMIDLEQKLKDNQNQMQINYNVIISKYELLDLCFTKIITYFYQNDKKIANTLQKIHDQQAQLFKTISDLYFNQSNRYKLQISQVKTKKQQLYKTQIKRLKSFQNQANQQISYLQNKNKQLLQKLLDYGKYIRLDPKKNTTTTPPHQASKTSRKHSPLKQNSILITVKDKGKNLTLNQFKQIMSQIYYSKQKHNIFCLQNHQPLQTMQSHMYTYLNQKYGLKSLAMQWAINIVNGIKKFGPDDSQIAIFGKILRNQSDQQFLISLHQIKQNFIQTYRKFKKNSISKQGSQISINQSEQVLLFMNFNRQQISVVINKIKDKAVNNVITVDKLQKALLDYFVKKHDDKVQKLYKQFNLVDDDQDGVITVEQFEKMVTKIFRNVDVDKVLQILDTSKKGVITFFYMCQIFLKHPDLKDQIKSVVGQQ